MVTRGLPFAQCCPSASKAQELERLPLLPTDRFVTSVRRQLTHTLMLSTLVTKHRSACGKMAFHDLEVPFSSL